jgi:hypothetical protein
MHEDERDLLEVLIFDEIEETVGTWLRAIIQRLEKEQTIRRLPPSTPRPASCSVKRQRSADISRFPNKPTPFACR